MSSCAEISIADELRCRCTNALMTTVHIRDAASAKSRVEKAHLHVESATASGSTVRDNLATIHVPKLPIATHCVGSVGISHSYPVFCTGWSHSDFPLMTRLVLSVSLLFDSESGCGWFYTLPTSLWPLRVDATDLCCLRDLMMMMLFDQFS